MASSLFGIGLSGLLTSQRALGTVSHNIANVNNAAYSRQRNEITAREPQFIAGGFKGTGAQLADVNRLVDDFLVNEIRTGTSSVARTQVVNELASRLDNLVAAPESGLSPIIDRFFGAIQDMADDPVASAPRSVVLAEARALVRGFHALDSQLAGVEESINERMNGVIDEVNDLATGLADINADIRQAVNIATTSQPNDLFDQRDELLRRLSSLVDVTAVEQDNVVNVTVGTGQPLVVGTFANTLSTVANEFDPTRREVAVSAGGTATEVSRFIGGGELGGLLEARGRVIDPARNILGRIAVALSDAFNEQHRQGLDLRGNLGGAFFNDLGDSTVGTAASTLNTGTASVTARITDTGQLTTSDYRLERDGATLTLTRLADGTTTDVSADLAGLPGASTTTVDGVELTVSGSLADGDRFLVQPTRLAARDLELVVRDPQRLAAAWPATTAAALTNAGGGVISPAEVVDPAAFPQPYAGNTIVMADSVPLTAGGATGTPADAGTGDSLGYELRINGVTVHTQNEGGVALADAAAVAAAINDDVAATGVRAYVEGGQLFLAREPATRGDIVITEALTGASDASDAVTGYFGSTLNGPGGASPSSSDITFSAAADSFLVLDDTGTPIQSGGYGAGTPIGFNGVEVTIDGAPVNGDTFSVAANTFGVGDNRNALALADLQRADILNDGTASFQEGYGDLVVHIGGAAREAGINLDAQQTLLDNSLAARAEKSGVNLDEEAADLLLFQQSYQAAAQVIAAADKVFQELLAATRG